MTGSTTCAGPRQRKARAIQVRDKHASDCARRSLTRLTLRLAAPFDALVLVDARIDVAAVAGAHVAHLAPGQSRGRGTCGGGHVIGHATMSPVELSIALAEAEDPSGTCTTSQPATQYPAPSTRRTS